MNVWFAPHEDNTLQNVMGIAGCTLRKWSGEAAVQARYGMIDLVEAAGAILGLDQETAWTLLRGRFTAPKGMAGNVALVMTTRDDNATERVHGVLRQSGRYHPAAGLDPERLKGAEKLLVMAADGEAGAGNHAWPPALSDEEITNTRHAIAQYLIEATIAQPAERQ